LCHQHPQVCTHEHWITIKTVLKTTIYTIKLDLTVDNLCNCVEKHGDKPVLGFFYWKVWKLIADFLQEMSKIMIVGI